MSARPPAAPRPLLRARVEFDGLVLAEGEFDAPFVVGRSDAAGLRVDDVLVSREHAEIVYTAGCWWVRDLGSANGTYVGGRRIVEVPIGDGDEVELGRGGPRVLVEEIDAPPPSSDASLTQVIGHYFDEGDGQAGERTQLIRDAYRRVHRSHRRRVWTVVGVSAVLLAGALGVVMWQQARVAQLERLAQEVFVEMRAQDRQIAQFRRLLTGHEGADLAALLEEVEAVRGAPAPETTAAGTPLPPATEGQPRARRRTVDAAQLQRLIAEAETRRQRIETQYDAFVEDLGVYRDATLQEQEILRVARLFNESEFAVPAGFAREVLRTVEWWRRHGLAASVRRAEAAGYTPVIVGAMRRHGLPPEFFYLALVESHFDERAVGPPTRWGIAKGMWQFIPTTALDYGLTPGPLAGEPVYDPADERFDVPRATDAAAQYLLKLYTDIAQASGLLAMASYNWGEGRVLPRLRNLPAPAPDATPLQLAEQQLALIPQDPQQRSYWRFLTTYGNQMPEETRNYVLRIFSAAVIGRNPRLFGFDFDNPLAPHLQADAGTIRFSR